MGMSMDTAEIQMLKEKTKSRCVLSSSVSMGDIRSLTNRKIPSSVPSRYLETKISSCHELCKHGKMPLLEEKTSFLTEKRIRYIRPRSNDPEKTAVLEVGEKKSSIIDVSEKERKSTIMEDGVKALTTNAASALALGNAADKKRFETRATLPVSRCRSPHSKIGGRTPGIKSTSTSTTAKDKVQLPVTASFAPRTPSPKAEAASISTVNMKKVLPPAIPVARANSVDRGSSIAARNLKRVNLPLNDKNHPIGKEKPDRLVRETRESKTTGGIKVGVCGSDISSLSEIKGLGRPRGRATSPMTPQTMDKNLRRSRSVKDMKEQPSGAITVDVCGSDISPLSEIKGLVNPRCRSTSPMTPRTRDKILRSPRSVKGMKERPPLPPGSRNSSSGRSSSSSPSAASSSGPSRTSSRGGTDETPSVRGTTKKDNRVTGSGVIAKSKPRRAGILEPEDGPPDSSHKLQFRRGRVVDPKMETVTSPRWLRFWKMRSIGDTQQGISNAVGKSSKRTEAGALVVKSSTTSLSCCGTRPWRKRRTCGICSTMSSKRLPIGLSSRRRVRSRLWWELSRH
ncbi:hypothetical protein SAY86_016686 [Trapa natans]|uniref:Uncharacterized protein n=1 Tax=Trapa natans TaxID=22666 RepID=A0AAN7QWJ2_TRANT|nr:hypothetical protein SAY86_016686 [Trapa natans]